MTRHALSAKLARYFRERSSIHGKMATTLAMTLAVTFPFAVLGAAVPLVTPPFIPPFAPVLEFCLSAGEALILAAAATLVVFRVVVRPLLRELEIANDRHVALQSGCHQCAQELIAEGADDDAINRAKSQFIATISHELRTPLNAIIGFSQIIRDDTRRQGPQAVHADFAQEIHASGVHLLSLVNEMLELASIEADTGHSAPEWLDIHQLMAGCCRLMATRTTTAGLTVTTAVSPEAEMVFSNPQKLRQIVNHLLSNAIKFTPPGGAIAITADTSGDNVVLEVIDTGIGIAPDDVDKVFQPFWQAAPVMSRRYDGSGLGLSLVQSLVQHLGGHVEIDSAPGRGTRVRVVLPLRVPANVTSLRDTGRDA